jgi:hypothetical protein
MRSAESRATMESFLNLLWVAIAAVAFGFWRTRWLHDRSEHRRNPLREWTAFACALVLLFFVVSLTDDLHSELVIFDECSASRRPSLALVQSHDAPPRPTFALSSGVAMHQHVALLDPPRYSSRLIPGKEFLPSFIDVCIRSDRSPPAVSS